MLLHEISVLSRTGQNCIPKRAIIKKKSPYPSPETECLHRNQVRNPPILQKSEQVHTLNFPVKIIERIRYYRDMQTSLHTGRYSPENTVFFIILSTESVQVSPQTGNCLLVQKTECPANQKMNYRIQENTYPVRLSVILQKIYKSTNHQQIFTR